MLSVTITTAPCGIESDTAEKCRGPSGCCGRAGLWCRCRAYTFSYTSDFRLQALTLRCNIRPRARTKDTTSPQPDARNSPSKYNLNFQFACRDAWLADADLDSSIRTDPAERRRSERRSERYLIQRSTIRCKITGNHRRGDCPALNEHCVIVSETTSICKRKLFIF